MRRQSEKTVWLALLFLLSAVTVLVNPALAADQVKNPNLNDSGAVINEPIPPTNPQIKFYGVVGQPVIGASDSGTNKVEIGVVYTWLGGATIEVKSPKLEENWLTGMSHRITWESKGISKIAIHVKTEFGVSLIAPNVDASTGEYPWTPQQSLFPPGQKTTKATIEAKDMGSPLAGQSAPFILVLNEAPVGTVPLYITKDGTTSNLLITWESAVYANPQIFVLAGDGSGQYVTDGLSWKLYSDASFSGQFNASQYSLGILKHLSQIKAGYNEVYYKGLQAGINPADLSPAPEFAGKTYLATAWGVGKTNLTILPTKSSLVGLPFEIDSAKQFFLDQLSGSDHIVFLPEQTDEGGGVDWYDGQAGSFNCDPAVTIKPRDGFWIENKAASAFNITFFGPMLKVNIDAVLNSQGKPYSLTGNPLALNISTDANIGLNGDVVEPQLTDNTMGLDYFAKKTDGTWPSGFSTLNFKQGFWYWGNANQRRWLIDRIVPSAQITGL